MIDVEPDDLPQEPTSGWMGMVGRMVELDVRSPQMERYYRDRVFINAHRSRTRPSRAKSEAPRVYGGVPVVVRRAVRDHVAEVRRAQREARRRR